MRTTNMMKVLLPVLALTMQACGWGVDGVDRMNELYPKDAGPDGEVVAGDAIGEVASDVTDTAEEDVADVTAGDTVSDTAAGDTNEWPDVSYETIEGRWAVRLVSNADMDVVLAQTKMATADLFIAEATSSGMTLTFCDEIITVTPTETFSTSTVTKAALREAIAATPVEMTVSGNSVAAQQVVWKWALADSIGADDPLPAVDKDNPEINFQNYPDIDSDTHEGVTISVTFNMYGAETVGERYMAKRSKFEMAEGAMSGDGRWITGGMTFATEEKVLGADQGILKNGATITPVTEGTKYQLRRVDGAFDCATLVADHEALFAAAPQPAQ